MVEGSGSRTSDARDPVPLGAYAARSCAAVAQWDVIEPAERAPDTPFMRMLADRGLAFEAEIFRAILEGQPDALDLGEDLRAAEREAMTGSAMRDGVRIILRPRLPADVPGGRVGMPDLLVKVPGDPATYLPVDIKHHRVLPSGTGASVATGSQPLDGIDAVTAVPLPTTVEAHDSAKKDLLQLAHYRRMLEACGFASSGPALGGVIGREAVLVWFDLAVPRFAVTKGRNPDRRSALELYDTEFALRRRVADTAAAHLADPSIPLAIEPVLISDCDACRWRDHCISLLEAREDVSLLPRVTRPAWEALRSIGVSSVRDLARLDAGDPVDGLTTAALTKAVALARARVGPDAAYRQPGAEGAPFPRHDVELDIDMENVEEGAYLWGVWVEDRAGVSGLEAGYHAFVDWDADARVAGERAFARLWEWLEGLRVRAASEGFGLAAYCWSAAAENRWLRVGGTAHGVLSEVEAFITSPAWIDLMREFDDNVITGHPTGLKTVAPLLGFDWADEDPDGGASMVWWQQAVAPDASEAERTPWRERILAYNRDDVRATLHVRDWLARNGHRLPPVPGPV